MCILTLTITNQDPYGFHAFIQGILFILSFYNILMFIQNKNKMFLFYSLFVGCLLIYFTHHEPLMFHGVSVPTGTSIFLQGTQFVAYIFYIAYVQEIIDSKNRIPRWHFILKIAKRILILFTVILFFLEHLLPHNILYRYILSVFVIIEIFAIINYFIFFRIKGRISKLLILGSVIYMICANISLIGGLDIHFKSASIEDHFNYGMFMEVGAVLESLIFAIILGYRMDYLEKEQKKSKIRLLEKTIEASDMKMKALKAQMNPHFIFNVLNSINNFIIKNNKKEASEYLTKFAKLVRSVLDHSEAKTISLQQELISIEQYISLEKLRIKNGFDFQLIIARDINIKKIQIPPLFLQPYIENAIWHGLSQKKGTKLLIVEIFKSCQDLIITIKDNGIGRKKSSCNALVQKSKSFGTKITEERIKMTYPLAHITINDILCQKLNNIIGTKVSIQLPHTID